MFIGGLNWETTDGTFIPPLILHHPCLHPYFRFDLFVYFLIYHNIPQDKTLTNPPLESLKDYFSQFGEVLECTVMRDGASGRSRGFGFLTFKDARTVNVVMVKEHYLDGKIVSSLSLPPSPPQPHH